MSFAGQGWVLVQPSEGQVHGATSSQSSSGGGIGSLLNQLAGARPTTCTSRSASGSSAATSHAGQYQRASQHAAARVVPVGLAARRARAPVGQQPQRARQLAAGLR